MSASAYYDSCIFMQAHNPTHREQKACLALTSPASIAWIVWICKELIESETTIAELVIAFETSCALEGKVVEYVDWAKGKGFASRHNREKRELELLHLKSRDFKHLMCAVSARAEVFATVDQDFWDADNKRVSKARIPRDRTKRKIEELFDILVLLPSQLLDASR